MTKKKARRAPRKKPQPSPPPEPKGFAPTAAMIRFLFHELEHLGKRKPYTQKQIAEASKVSEFQASRWHEVDGYDAWHAEQLHGAAIRLFNRGKVAVGYRILMTGDPKELETFGRVLGLLTTGYAPEDSGAAAFNVNSYTFNCLVPRPPVPQLAADAPAAAVLTPRPSDIPTVATR